MNTSTTIENNNYVIGYSVAKRKVLDDPNHNPVIFRVCPTGIFSVMRYFYLRMGTPFAIGDGSFTNYKDASVYAESLVHIDILYKVYYDGMLCFSTNKKSRALAYRDFLQKNYQGKVDLNEQKVKA